MKHLKRFEKFEETPEMGVSAEEFEIQHSTTSVKDFDEGYGKELSKKDIKKLVGEKDKKAKKEPKQNIGFDDGYGAKELSKKKMKKLLKESLVNGTEEEQLAYYKKISRTHFGQKSDNVNDSSTAHSTTKFYNDMTRKWEDISFEQIKDRIKSLEQEIASK